MTTDVRASSAPAAPVRVETAGDDAEPTRLVLPARGYRIGGVFLGQIVAAQVAVVAAVAAYPAPDAVFLPVLGVALAVLAVLFVRRGRRWWYQEIAKRLRYGRRARQRVPRSGRQSAASGVDRRTFVAPSVVYQDVTDRKVPKGIAVDSRGWYAAMSVTNGAAGLDRLASALTSVTTAASATQLVHHVVLTPTEVSDAGQWTWVAVRVAAGDGPEEAANRGGGIDGVHRTIFAACGRVSQALGARRVTSKVLVADELAATLAAVGGWDPADPVTGRAAPEHWTCWHGADAEHVCFLIGGTLLFDDLVAQLRATSAQSVTVSLRFSGAAASAVGMLRVGAPLESVDATVAEVRRAVAEVGGSLYRLDGAHGPAIYAIAPTASNVLDG